MSDCCIRWFHKLESLCITGSRSTFEFPSRVNLSGSSLYCACSMDRTSRCNKVDAVRLFASYRNWIYFYWRGRGARYAFNTFNTGVMWGPKNLFVSLVQSFWRKFDPNKLNIHRKESSLCFKLKYSNPFIFLPPSCKLSI